MQPGERQVAPTREGIRRDHVARYEWTAALLKRRRLTRAVDVACGVGYGTNLLAQFGFRTLGIDGDSGAIAYAREHYAHPRATFRRADVGRDVKLGRHDAAVCLETIEHLRDPRPLLKALRRAAPLLVASVPNQDVYPWEGQRFHFRHYTRAQFEALLNSAGWEATSWAGQEGPESEVDRNCEGRTIIVTAKRGKTKHKEVAPAVPNHVVILGLGPSVAEYLNIVRRLGGRKAFADEVWGINALGDVFVCDRIFHMDDVRIQEIRAAARPESNIAAMLAWMKTHLGPIYTSRAHPDYPGLVELPLEDVIHSVGFAYMNNTAAHALAYAIHLGVKKVTLFGCDYTYPNAHHAEKGRACLEFLLGIAHGHGIKISIPQVSSLMDACVPAERLYGYDAVNVHMTRQGNRLKLKFTDKAKLPTAEEIENRYDHERHPSPLVKS